MKKMKTILSIATILLSGYMAMAVHADVVSTSPIVDERFWGYRVIAVAVEYDHVISAQDFELDTFSAADSWETGSAETRQVMMEREIARIYTNSEASVLPEGASDGNYVIVEFVDDPLAPVRPGELSQRGYYDNPDTGSTEMPRMVKANCGTVSQLASIEAADGTILEPFSEMEMTNGYIYPDSYYEFELIQIHIPTRERPYQAYVRLPDNYEEGKTYPVLFAITGGSQLEYIGNGMDNTDVVMMFDHMLLAWTEARKYGFDNLDFIVVSLRHQNTAPSLVVEGDDPYEDTAEAAKWILENYPIDQERVFWAGESQGSVTCLNVLWRHPELAKGYFGTNGGLSARADFSPEGWTQDYYEQTMECLQTFADNNIKICMTFGEQDGNSANAYAAKVYAQILHDAYAEKGLSEREIYDMAKIRVFPHSTYDYAEGLIDHNVARMMYWLDTTKIDMFKVVSEW